MANRWQVSGNFCIGTAVLDCEIITDLEECKNLWTKSHNELLPFGNWSLRVRAAEVSKVRPFFMRHRSIGTVLPLGLSDGKVVFYGGKVYSERNTFLGPKGGESDLFGALIDTGRPFRLLSWNSDPLKLAGTSVLKYEVPYNQFWIVDPFPDVEVYLDNRLQSKHIKEFRYLLRKYEYNDLNPRTAAECLKILERFIELTMESFAKRNAVSIYQESSARGIILATCMKAYEENTLRMTVLEYKSKPCGLAVFVDDERAARATYLLNLYAPSPSDISNGVTCAVIRYACSRGKAVDGLRGSFTLKKKFGFRAEPSFALVRDSTWIARPQSDLSPSEVQTLYGRSFEIEN
jgi:hypothetical protein